MGRTGDVGRPIAKRLGGVMQSRYAPFPSRKEGTYHLHGYNRDIESYIVVLFTTYLIKRKYAKNCSGLPSMSSAYPEWRKIISNTRENNSLHFHGWRTQTVKRFDDDTNGYIFFVCYCFYMVAYPIRWAKMTSLVKFILGCLSSEFESHFVRSDILAKGQKLVEALERPKGVPLITVSNHISTIDDPVMWSPLNNKYLTQQDIRWSLVAHEVCYINTALAYFFMLTRNVPIVRGAGVYQEGVNFAIERLSLGDWVHVFPEGKINDKMENMRLKWGVGRMIYESPEIPIVLPIHVIGLQHILQPRPPYIIRPFKKVTINHGEPLSLKDLVKELRDAKPPPEVARKDITDAIELGTSKLKKETEKLHDKQ